MEKLEIKQAKLKHGQYYDTAEKKVSIFLHHTAGSSAEGALKWWDQTPEKVGTAYVIDRDGTIFQAFDDSKWGFHLGRNDDNNICEKQSIGIEIVSRGQLYEEKGKYYHYPLYPNKASKKEIPKEEVWILDQPINGHKHFHNYTKEQIVATINLIAMLVKKHGIIVQADYKEMFKYNPQVAIKNFPGIWSHCTVRKDKVDVIPHKDLTEPLFELLSKLVAKPKKE